ncbi:MAG: hypothetical protein Q9227_009201 [Pyrenula ochraceoflavens]
MPGQIAKVMPTRLLELAIGDDHPHVKVVETAQLEVDNISYAALSHCWGDTLPIRLVKSLLEDHYRNIPWLSLPLTFQDAITTALKLDILYLWIDALCIVQDDNDDWTYEATRMAGIYSNSYLTIAADASWDGTEGLFRQRNPTRLRSIIVPQEVSVVDRRGFVLYTDRWWDSIYHSPLASRAWTVQEKFLAPRLLHFAEEEVHWECMEMLTAESVPANFPTVPKSGYIVQKSSLHLEAPPEQRIQTLYHTWYQLVSAYAKGTLTFTSDRPIAIAGLARTFCRLLELPDHDYLCGLWRPRLGHDLMWRSHSDGWGPPENLRVASLPSWSWLSLCTGTWMFPGQTNDNGNFDDLIVAEIVRASTVPIHDSFGPVWFGKVTLRTPLCQVTIRKADHPFYQQRKNQTHVLDFSGSLLQEDKHFTFCPDDTTGSGMDQILNGPVYLMLGRAVKPEVADCASEKAITRSEDPSKHDTVPHVRPTC